MNGRVEKILIAVDEQY